MDLPALPRSVRRLATRQDGMLTWAQIRQTGITRRQLDRLVREAGWSIPFRGTVLLPDAHPLRGPVRAALIGRPDAVVCGVSAARLLGLPGLPATPRQDDRMGDEEPPTPDAQAGHSMRTAGTMRTTKALAGRRLTTLGEPVHLLVPRSTHAAGNIVGLIRHLGTCRPEERQLSRDIPVTTVERTLADLILDSDRETAVGLLDAALQRGRVSDIDAVLRSAAGRRGVVARRNWFALADGRAESPLETRLRLLLLDAGLPPEELQWQVRGPRNPTEPDKPRRLVGVGLVEGTSDDPPDRDQDRAGAGRPVARLTSPGQAGWSPWRPTAPPTIASLARCSATAGGRTTCS